DRGLRLFSLYADAARDTKVTRHARIARNQQASIVVNENQIFSVDPQLEKVTGPVAFELYDTYGFPLDMTQLLAAERGLTVDVASFEAEMEKQRERGRAA